MYTLSRTSTSLETCRVQARARKPLCPTARFPPAPPASAESSWGRSDVGICSRAPHRNGHSKPTVRGVPAAGAVPPAADSVLTELKALEAERDTAITAAEASSKTGTKLAEMARLLQQLALEKVRAGDEEAARKVLVEKSAVSEALERTAAKAEVNYTLARKLAARIADVQNTVLNAVNPGAATASSSPSSGARPAPSSASSSASFSSSSSSSSSYSSSGSGNGGHSSTYRYSAASNPLPYGPASVSSSSYSTGAPPHSASRTTGGSEGSAASWSSARDDTGRSSSSSSAYPPPPSASAAPPPRTDSWAAGAGAFQSSAPNQPQWKWEQSLVEARLRLAAEEAKATAEGAGARARRSAADALAEAQARLRQQAERSVADAQARLREQTPDYGGSLEAAQARLRARDQEVLEYVRRVMARHRQGLYVSEDELEFAFRQLERSMM